MCFQYVSTSFQKRETRTNLARWRTCHVSINRCKTVTMKVLSFCMYLYVTLSFKGLCGSMPLQEQTHLIRAVSDHLNCKSVIFLTSNLDPLGHEIILEKHLNSPLQLYTAIWDFKTFIRTLYSDDVIVFRTLMVIQDNISNLENLVLVSKKFSLASFDWLILSTVFWEIGSHFNGVIIPFHCRFIVSATKGNGSAELFELYRISKNSELLQKSFASWSFEKGLHPLEGDFFSKRMDLKGHQFKFAVHNSSYEINPCEDIRMDNGKQMIQCAYFEVWKDLERLLNYTTKYVVIEDCYKNGSTGISTPMLEMIRTGGADSGEDGYIWSSSRLIYNQFFWPLFHSKVILVTKIPSRKFSFASYVRPFDTNMWLALISWLLLSGSIITLTKFMGNSCSNRKIFSVPNETADNLFLPFTAICYQSSYFTPKKAAIRIAYLMIYLIPVLLIPSYSGSVISSLSVPSENIPFSDLNEFEKVGTHQLSAINNTFFQVFLMTDEKFEILRQKKLISTEMTVSYEQSFNEICSRKVTFLYEWPLLTKYSINCNVFKFDLSLKKIFSSMAVRKNFPYLDLFNRQIQKLITSGLNVKILEKSTLKLSKHEINPFPQNYFQIKPFGLEDVLPLFAVLGVGILLSLILLTLENHLVKAKKLTNNKVNAEELSNFE